MNDMKISMILIFIFTFVLSLYPQDSDSTINPEKEKDIIYLLKISGTADFAYIIIDDVIANYKQYIKDTPDDYWDRITVETDIMPFVKSIVPVYDKRFTREEIKELIKFFESPTGNKWALALKDMNDEIMQKANIFGQNIFKSINEKLIEDGYIVVPEAEESSNTEKNNNTKNK